MEKVSLSHFPFRLVEHRPERHRPLCGRDQLTLAIEARGDFARTLQRDVISGLTLADEKMVDSDRVNVWHGSFSFLLNTTIVRPACKAFPDFLFPDFRLVWHAQFETSQFEKMMFLSERRNLILRRLNLRIGENDLNVRISK
jgi:hypothetical protein